MINKRTLRRSNNSRRRAAAVPNRSDELVPTVLGEFVELLADGRVSMVVPGRSDGYKRMLAR